MAYTSTNRDNNERYEFRTDQPTISKLVKPSNDSHTAERHNTDNSYISTRRHDEDRYANGSGRTGDSAYESMKRSGDERYPVQRLATNENRQEIDRRGAEYSRRVPTAHITVDPARRPADGNARTCVMEINIAVSMGGGRAPQASLISSNVSSKPPAIRSEATIEDVRYIDLKFQAPQNTAQLATDGIIRRPPS